MNMVNTLTSFSQKIGNFIINNISDILGYLNLFLKSISHVKSLIYCLPVRMVFYKQVYFTGIEATSEILLLALILGIVTTTQIYSIIGPNAELTDKILVWLIVKGLGPLMTAFIVINRSGTALASELASMKINGEIKNLLMLGIDYERYLILPRIVGVSISIFCLSFVFQCTSVLGGILVSALILDIPLWAHFNGIASALNYFDITASTLKSLVFGMIISTVSCYQGINVKTSITEIPQAVSRAVMHCFNLIFLSDAVITAVILL